MASFLICRNSGTLKLFNIFHISCSLLYPADPAGYLAGFPEEKQRVQYHLLPFHTGHFRDFQKPAAFIPQPSQINDQVNPRSDLPPDCLQGQFHPHQYHGFQEADRILRAVGMAGGKTPVMAGVQAGQKFESLRPADLADDQTCRTHDNNMT